MLQKTITILIGYLDILPTIASIAILIFVSAIVSGLIAKIVKFFLPKTLDPALITFIPRASKFFSFILGIILAMGAAGMSTTSITAMFGISTLAIGMSLKDLFMNTVQGIMILINKPFKFGDEITIGTAGGKVIRIGLMYTRLDCNGEYKLIPNNKIFTEIVTVKK